MTRHSRLHHPAERWSEGWPALRGRLCARDRIPGAPASVPAAGDVRCCALAGRSYAVAGADPPYCQNDNNKTAVFMSR
jgi:hypothetical protein